jgi:hypothetical protein
LVELKLYHKEIKYQEFLMSVYTYFRWLSLDIVLGAIFFLGYINCFYALHLPLVIYAELGLAVWVIYLLDHLIDSRRSTRFFSSRHQFYRDSFTVLSWICLVAVISACVLLPFLPETIFINGLMLSLFSCSYLILVKYVPKFWIKEVLIASGYTTGLFLVPYSLVESLVWSDYLFFGNLFFIALSNLVVFSIYDLGRDVEDSFPSIVQKIGLLQARKYCVVLLTVSLTIAFVLFTVDSNLGLMFLSMNLILILLLAFPSRFEKNDTFRVIGDGIFYLPLIFMLIGQL